MARIPVPRTPLALAAATDQFITALGTAGGLAASGLTAAQLTDLGNLATAVRNAETARDEAEGTYRAAVQAADGAHEALETRYRTLRSQADKHSNMTDELRAQAGIGTPDPLPGPDLPTVTDLAASRRAAGVVFLDWSGPSGSNLRYEVFVRENDEAPWDLVGSASATDFTHEGVATGSHRQYQVVACRGERRGDPSSIAALDP
jgi:hypothetical protein